ncbi:MAG: redoxin domain-containing protein [Verrucomicrobia bacterium]|nr:redoxin domain-containing protein [Verrucomicrobiota bacterium]
MKNPAPLGIACLALVLGLPVCAVERPVLAIGQPAPDFDLPGIDGRNHRLAEYASSPVLVVLFTCNHCPTAQAAEERVKRMVADFRDKGVQWVAISPNDPKAVRIDELGYAVYGDDLEDMKRHAADHGFNFPYLYDGESQSVSRAFGVVATPQVFIFDQGRKLRYQGRIDDSKYEDGATRHDARNAIEALLAGQPVPVETTRTFGCSTKWSDKRDGVTEAEAAWRSREVTVETIDANGVKALAANTTTKLRLVNLWATWCGPCVEEFPHLVTLNRQFEGRGFDVITLSQDDPDQIKAVRDFLRSEHAALGKRSEVSVKDEGRRTNNYVWAGSSTDELAAALDPQWDGSVPYSLLIAPGGKIVYRVSGELDLLEMRRRIVGQLGRFYPKSTP